MLNKGKKILFTMKSTMRIEILLFVAMFINMHAQTSAATCAWTDVACHMAKAKNANVASGAMTATFVSEKTAAIGTAASNTYTCTKTSIAEKTTAQLMAGTKMAGYPTLTEDSCKTIITRELDAQKVAYEATTITNVEFMKIYTEHNTQCTNVVLAYGRQILALSDQGEVCRFRASTANDKLATANANLATANANLQTAQTAVRTRICNDCTTGWYGDGGVALVGGVCTQYCSSGGYCGTSAPYKTAGTDCTSMVANAGPKTLKAGDEEEAEANVVDATPAAAATNSQPTSDAGVARTVFEGIIAITFLYIAYTVGAKSQPESGIIANNVAEISEI